MAPTNSLPNSSWEFDALQGAASGRYILERTIGRGATGIVFLAHDVQLDRAVAIKMLDGEYAPLDLQRTAFLQEARTAARLSHPNVVPVHSVHEKDGVVFFVMAYVDGETLGEHVAKNGPMAFPAARRMLQEVAWALSYAHASGVFHSDIKPDNVLLERLTGRALVTDFGIARVRGINDAGDGSIIGTPLYMSPEQANGQPVDARSDLFSLGATGFYAVTGQPPFQGSNVAELLFKRIHEAAPPVRSLRLDLPRGFTDLVDQCLATDPDDRIQNAATVADRLEELTVVGRDVPRPVREFRRLSDRVAHRLIVLVPVAGVLVYALSAINDLRAEHTVLLLWVVWILVAELLVEPLGLFWAARRLQQSGITFETFREALRWEAESDDLKSGSIFRAPARIQLLIATLSGIVSVVSLAIGFVLTTDVTEQMRLSFRSFGVASALFALASFGALFATEWGTREGGPQLRRNAWAGSFGKWFFALARIRLKLGTRLGYQSRRPTESVISETIARQVTELPATVQAKLGEVLRNVAVLVDRSKRIRSYGPNRTVVKGQNLQHQLAHLERIRDGIVRVKDGTMTTDELIDESKPDVISEN